MSTICSYLPSLPAGRMLGMRRSVEISQRAFAAMRAWRSSMRQRRELLMLNDVELRELSLAAADVDREIGKPIWKIVRLTGR